MTFAAAMCFCEDTVIKKYIHHTRMYSHILFNSRASFGEKQHPKNQLNSEVLVECAIRMVNQDLQFFFSFSVEKIVESLHVLV